MKEQNWKNTVIEISKQPGYLSNSLACERAIRQDTSEGYRDALREIAQHPYYAVNDYAAKRALREK